MLGKTEILDTNLTGQRCPCTYHPAFSPNQLAKEGPDSVAPGVITALAQLCIDSSSLTGPSVQSELCANIWTGPQAE